MGENLLIPLFDVLETYNPLGGSKTSAPTIHDKTNDPTQVERANLNTDHPNPDHAETSTWTNIMDSMWVYDIEWDDGKGNRIKDKARLVGKEYTQQLSIDYNKTTKPGQE